MRKVKNSSNSSSLDTNHIRIGQADSTILRFSTVTTVFKLFDMGYDFDKIAKIVSLKSPQIIESIEKCKTKCSVGSVKAFHEEFHVKLSETCNLNEIIAPANFADISETFKILEKVPPCFAKQRKSASAAAKLNSTRLICAKRNDSASLLKLSLLDVEDATVPDLERFLQEYDEVQKKKQQVLVQDAAQARNNGNYVNGVRGLKRALNDLMKIIPVGLDRAAPIFDEREEAEIKELKESVEAFVFLRENEDLYPVVEMADDKDLENVSKLALELL